MNAEKTLKKRIDLIFGILCLPIANSVLVSVPMGILELLRAKGLSVSDYVMDFVAPQAIYPLLNLAVVLIAMRFLRRKGGIRGQFRRPTKEIFPWMGFFLGAVTVGNYASNIFILLFERLTGLRLPPVFEQYNPSTVGQGVLFFIVIAILPSLSEEFLFRGFAGGGLQDFNPNGAVILSAFAFGMAHATLQQIPFAIFMGLIFGLIYIRTSNLWYPILFHFINNAWACIITFVSLAAGDVAAAILQLIASSGFLAVGIFSFIWLKRKGQMSLGDMPRTVNLRAVIRCTVTSVGFWGFVTVYVLLTLANLFL